MLQKLSNKKLTNYEKYKGATLTKSGKKIALKILRKHRLWELFLVNKLDFKWDEVHEIAEQLEHIVSPEMVNRLDKFLDYPKYDPHGDPIPDKNGNIRVRKEVFLSDLNKNQHARVAVTSQVKVVAYNAWIIGDTLKKCSVAASNMCVLNNIYIEVL